MAVAQLGTDEPVRRVIRAVDLWTSIAADQLHGVAVLYEAGDTVFSFFPIMRSVIEHSAACTWILDPSRSSLDRAARAAVVHLESATAVLPAVSHMGGGKGTPQFRAAKAARKRLFAEIKAEFPNETSLDEPIAVNGVRRASPTDIVAGLGEDDIRRTEWGGIYDFLCCTATHPNLTAFEFYEFGPDGSVSAQADDEFVRRFLRAGCSAYNDALRHVVSYCGWPADAIEEFVDGIEEFLGEP